MSADRVRQAALVALLVAAAALVSGCNNTLFYGESTAFDLAIHLNDNPQTPIEINAGLKRHVGQVTPPVATEQNEGKTAAVGEAVSTLSGFRLRYQEDPGSVLLGDLYIRTQFATGAAAAALAKNPIQAVKVIDADFERDEQFVSPASRANRDQIVAGIKALDDAKAVQVACNPPVTNPKLLERAELNDPGCVERQDPAVARQFLIAAAFMDDRTDASFAKWKAALGLN